MKTPALPCVLRPCTVLSSAVLSSAALLLSAPALAAPVDRYPEGAETPRSMTAEEQAIVADNPIVAPRALRVTAPPAGPTRAPAEYEPMEAIVLAWEGSNSWKNILAQMAAAITTTGDADVWVYCDSSGEANTARNSIIAAGADASRIITPVKITDTIWIRDYGPQYVFEGGVRAAVDHTYNRPRPNDNTVPADFATRNGHLYYDAPLVHGGGNYHLVSDATGYATDLIEDENPSLSASQIVDIWRDYWGVETTLTGALPAFIDSTQHIDMWMQMASPTHVVISDWPTQSGTTQDQVCDFWAAELASRGFTVTRTPARSLGGTHYTYTNVVICNDLVLVPTYTNSTIAPWNATAISTWQSVFPSKTIVTVNSQAIVTAAGVLHCISKHIPANSGGQNPVAHLRAPNGAETFDPGETVTVTWISDDDVQTTAVDILFSPNGGSTFTPVATGEPDDGSYDWTVPDVATDNALIRVVVSDADANTGADDSDMAFSIAGLSCPADIDFDGDVDPDDINAFVDAFTDANPTNADLTGDGLETPDDINAFVTAFTNGC